MRKSDVVLLMLISIKGSVSQRHFLITVIYYYNIFLISLRIFHIVFSLALLFLQCLQITCLADDNVFAGLTPCNNPGQIICATCLSQNGIPYNWVLGSGYQHRQLHWQEHRLHLILLCARVCRSWFTSRCQRFKFLSS